MQLLNKSFMNFRANMAIPQLNANLKTLGVMECVQYHFNGDNTRETTSGISSFLVLRETSRISSESLNTTSLVRIACAPEVH